MDKIKASFDFDGTIEIPNIKSYAKYLVDCGHEIWIITSRFSNEECNKLERLRVINSNEKVFQTAIDCGISKNNIKFMNFQDKIDFIEKEGGFLFHLDDDDLEISFINDESDDDCVGVSTEYDWLTICNNLIKNI